MVPLGINLHIPLWLHLHRTTFRPRPQTSLLSTPHLQTLRPLWACRPRFHCQTLLTQHLLPRLALKPLVVTPCLPTFR